MTVYSLQKLTNKRNFYKKTKTNINRVLNFEKTRVFGLSLSAGGSSLFASIHFTLCGM